MIYRRRRTATSAPSGYYRFENIRGGGSLSGFGEGDFIRLRDEFGTVWNGTAELQQDNLIRFRFRNDEGRTISGLSDSAGIVLRDDRGNTWRGFLE